MSFSTKLSLFILISLGFSTVSFPANNAVVAQAAVLKSIGKPSVSDDQQAYDYAKNHKNTYIAIIWPRAKKNENYITKGLGQCANAEVIYTKEFKLTKDGAWNFYKNAHRGVTDMRTRSALSHYFKNIKAPYPIKAVLVQTDKPLDQIIKCKRSIREKLGISFWSLHMNDTHKETMEMAEVVFKDKNLKKLDTMKKEKSGWFNWLF